MKLDSDWGGHDGSRLGLDIGGTLAKLVFFESDTRPSWCSGRLAEVVKSLGGKELPRELQQEAAVGFCRAGSFWGEQDKELAFDDEELKGRFHFLCFRSQQMERFISLIAAQGLQRDIHCIYTTGGGAYKYSGLFEERLGIKLQPLDELGVVIKGIAWMVERRSSSEVHFLAGQTPLHTPAGSPRLRTAASPKFGDSDTEEECALPSRSRSPSHPVFLDDVGPGEQLFPFVLVNIGSGVSIVRVDGIDKFERISGSALGGGTFVGLCNLLCSSSRDFSEASCLAVEGDSSSVNLLVEDIYGGDYELPSGAKLPGKLVASFFAKAKPQPQQEASDASVLHALMTMISQNICQIAFLNARLHSLSRIIFTGNFLRDNTVAREVIATNMRRVSTASTMGLKLQAHFLQHEGYFGALGCFLYNVENGDPGQREEGPSTCTPSSPVRHCQRLASVPEELSLEADDAPPASPTAAHKTARRRTCSGCTEGVRLGLPKSWGLLCGSSIHSTDVKRYE
eukprot:TRINITY_DN64254_c0_g1_i1.p1 TRINITY_DN64254_c0_g1~~TRINITY_DN64254_c0_g1_i1.p1  ORF type:complete len:510 (-),score=95.73 TRINITY_DN64254_c0_g1_i1:41-1570(-)